MKKLLLFLLFLCPFSVFAEELIPSAESGILMEANSGKIIYEKDKDQRLSIASMTKMMAQIIIMEEVESGKIHWDDVVTASKNASDMGGSQIYLEAGEKMTVRDLMKGISVASGNDATVAMAEYISGTEEKFVERMNQKAKEMGLLNTHFVNCTGLDEKDHFSSSYDLALIALELILSHPDILHFSSIYEDYLRQNTNKKFWLVNTNNLLSQYEGTDGLKTGHTDDAGYCLAATTKRGQLRLIAIVLGESESKIRNQETMQLLDYGFLNTQLKQLKEKGEEIKRVPVAKAKFNPAIIVLNDSLNVVEETGYEKNYSFDVKIDPISLPMKAGTVVGKIHVLDDGEVISSEKLVLKNDLVKIPFLDLYFQNIQNVFSGIF